jgi:formate dehydrogenase gamma subunit
MAKVHVDENLDKGIGSVVNRWVKHIYTGLIIGTIGLMLLHNLLALYRKAAAHRPVGPTVDRMNRSQRIQHLLLLSSFILLAWTGFALKYPDSVFSWLLGSNELIRRNIHRIAGVLMLGLGVYHTWYILFTQDGRQLVRDLWPRWQDARDAWKSVTYLLGLNKDKPKFGRFGYVEKAEYWAVVWGTIIMGATGLMIWFKIDVTMYLPRWAVDVSTTIHYYEAILACLAIVVWHFYHVFFDPDIYPGGTVFLNGRMPADLYRQKHPLDTKTLAQAKEAPGTGEKAD